MLKKYFSCLRRGRGWTGTSRFFSNFYRILPRIKKHMKDLFFTFVTMKEDIHELTYRLADSGGVKKSTFIVLGTFFRIAYVVVFFYLSYANYVSLRTKQKFVSLSPNSGNSIHIFPIYSTFNCYWLWILALSLMIQHVFMYTFYVGIFLDVSIL